MELSPFKASIDFSAFGDKFMSDYQTSYYNLPFTVAPFLNTVKYQGIVTKITYNNSIKPDTILSISSGWNLIDNIDNNIYLVRLRASNIVSKPYYVSYQIIKFKREVN